MMYLNEIYSLQIAAVVTETNLLLIVADQLK